MSTTTAIRTARCLITRPPAFVLSPHGINPVFRRQDESRVHGQVVDLTGPEVTDRRAATCAPEPLPGRPDQFVKPWRSRGGRCLLTPPGHRPGGNLMGIARVLVASVVALVSVTASSAAPASARPVEEPMYGVYTYHSDGGGPDETWTIYP